MTFEQKLYCHVVSHIDNERHLLDAYHGAAEQSRSAAFRYLLSLIAEEESRHCNSCP